MATSSVTEMMLQADRLQLYINFTLFMFPAGLLLDRLTCWTMAAIMDDDHKQQHPDKLECD